MIDCRKVPVLVPGRLNPDTLATLTGIFDVRHRPGQAPETLPEAERAEIRAVALMGVFTADMMDQLPNLEIIAHFGVGYDGVNATHAAANGIVVTNTPDVLTEEVADTTLGLLLNVVRELSRAETYLRAGRWEKDGNYPLTPMTLRGRSAGIMGLGRIGLAIARRLEAFGVSVAYHNRARRDDVAYAYHARLEDLAAAVDTLIIAAPGGAGTDKAVNGAVLKALGPDGVLINIGRGTTVDEAALIEALKDGTIRAAGLDVFENEPRVPQALIDLENTVLFPHVASASIYTRKAMGDLVIRNLEAWFAGEPPVTPVPETVGARLHRRG